MPISVLTYLLVIVCTAFILGAVMRFIKQPPVIGYLIAGFILSLFLKSNETNEIVNFLSELGIVFLLFTLGIEFSFKRLGKVAHIAIIGAIVQILTTMLFGTLLITGFGFSLFAAFFMASAFSLSSTAIVVKILTDKGEMDTLPGEIMVGWLVVQDLAVLPLMIILPSLGKEMLSGGLTPLSFLLLAKNTLFAFLALGLVLYAGKHLVPWILKKIAGLNSRELLLVSVFIIVIIAAVLTQQLGLSAAIGAFLAGLLIAESSQMHAVFSEIRPLRDLFAMIFFATLGLILPDGFILQNIMTILSLSLVIMLVKFVIVLSLVLYLGYHAKTSFIVGVGLIEIGEFAFVLARVGLFGQTITTFEYGMIVSVALTSILIMPPLFLATPRIYTLLRESSKKRWPYLYTRLFTSFEHRQMLEELPLRDHVVLCGYGRVGKYVGAALELAKIPYLVVEYNQKKATALKERRIPVVYGDPADIDILDYAQVDKARAVVIAIPDLHTQEQVIVNSQTLKRDIIIYCRSHQDEQQKMLQALGVTEVIQPEYEASVSISRRLLQLFSVTPTEIEKKISQLTLVHQAV
ncbi:TPA: hypothetical protein DIV55_07120 [Patescibacteria group bacterium]|uniref:Sodium/hydrogen exchanger n=1 Tax=Candidatus Gottesmanbacteria bacterium GW2011_GWA1_43_11 TaxID=1618436 RepID=A0A0G1CIL6_9BACT|nr:MAG: Sodium/hydrogen exchanger [Candidatus Gottesmanbacteria bacterium GW2011_GWA1_43_11]HCS79474.1 hypothetical protein [Patescibacteria group bacterium]